MKYTIKDIGGSIVKEDDRYIVKDNTFLKNLILSSTELNPGKKTSGHRHAGQDRGHRRLQRPARRAAGDHAAGVPRARLQRGEHLQHADELRLQQLGVGLQAPPPAGPCRAARSSMRRATPTAATCSMSPGTSPARRA